MAEKPTPPIGRRADGTLRSPGQLVGDPRGQELGLFPEKEIVIRDITLATSSAASVAALRIHEFTGGRPEIVDLEKAEKDRRTIIIDTDSDTAFKASLSTSTNGEYYGIDAEGGKEAAQDKLGVAMPLAVGVFGTGDRKASFVIDVVEGTTAAAHGRPEAVSIVGISDFNGITKIPDLPNGQEVTYFRKLFAPAAYKDELEIEASARHNLERVMRTGQIPAEQITLAVMKRQCNATIIREAQELGVNVVTVSAGDLAWGLRAILSDPEHPILMMGRGGAQEGSIAAVAAHALDATGQLRVVEEPKDIEVVDHGKIWTADEFVPGQRDHSMVIFSSITANTHFDMEEVRRHEDDINQHVVKNLVIASSGLQRLTVPVALR